MFNLDTVLRSSALSLVLIGLSTHAAVAQSSGTGERLLDEIVVTAQKKAENSQDVPIAISAFSGDALEAIGLSESDELGQFVPGLEIASTSGEGSQLVVYLRGAGLNDFNNNNSGPIGIYSDEVYISSPVLTSFQFFDTERLEVLKGPQGTLYGRNTTGGAIKFISNKPTEEFSLSGRAAYESFDTTVFEGAVSGPIADNVRGRFAVNKSDSDGYVDNLLTGEPENGTDTLYWRGILDVDVSENVFVRANLHGAKVDSKAFKYNNFGIGPGGTDALGYASPDDIYTGEYNRDGRVNTDAIGGYLEAKIDFGNVNLTSITSYDTVDYFQPEETDGSPANLLYVEYAVESDTFMQELRLDGTIGSSLNWLAGVFYLDETLDQDQSIDLFGDVAAFTGGLADPFGVATGGAPVIFARTLNEQDTESYAIFGQGDFAISDRLTATVGARYTKEKREFLASAQLEDDEGFIFPVFDAMGDFVIDPNTMGPATAILPAGVIPVYEFPDLSLSDDAFSWRLGLDYKANDDTLLYASIARGFKSGGFNGGFLNLDPAISEILVQPYDPEFLTAYEVGLKTDLFDNRLRLNASAFYNDFKDLQVFTLINTGTLPLQVLDNSSAAEVKGFELDATFYPTSNFLMNLSASFMDAKLKDFQTDGGADFSGNKIAYTPDTSISGLARYDHDLSGNGSVYVQSSFAYKSDQFFSTENDPIASQDAYTLVNARLGYESENGEWGVALYGKNLGDTEYLTNVTSFSDFGFYSRFVGRPRAYGVELTFDF